VPGLTPRGGIAALLSLVGSGLARAGWSAIAWSGLGKTIGAIFLSPALGFVLALVLVLAVSWAFVRTRPALVDTIFRQVQFVSASLYSLGHGGNDAQKTMGIITAVLAAGGILAYGPNGTIPPIPLWVVLIAHAAIALGTLSGGWRIVHTMGSKITKLRPIGGFCAETGAAITLAYVTLTGTPVSTTHTITGAIVGVGATRRLSAVKWGVAGRIVWAWILTIPAAGVIAGVSFWLVRLVLHLSS